ncbi:MAG: CRTAC1 family protein [Sedimentisphaerales bacterium]
MFKKSILLLLLTFQSSYAVNSKPNPLFVDKTSELGIKFSNNQVACIDYNNDGWVDIYSSTELWKNNEGRGFTKVFDKGSDAIWADFDNDGFIDLFCYGTQQLFWNDHGNGFIAREFPKLSIASSLGASWADYNGDGFVDLYIGGYENWTENITYPDVLVMNNQGKSWKIAFSDDRYRARGVTSCDFDNDGDVDIYVANYRLQPNVLWRNDGSGKFVDVAVSHNAVATWKGFKGGHSIGAAWGDFDNDGNIDIFAGNFAHDDSRGHQPHSFFLRNTGHKTDYVFKNMGQCGLHYQESYASPAVADYDNDGDLDLYFTTVYATASFGKKNYPVLYRNEGNWKFVDVTEESGVSKLGPTYQAAWADIDNDGDVDLITDGKIFINQGNSNSWLKVKLFGDGKIINSDAIGSQVRIRLKGKILTRQVEAGTGQGNQNELTLHFGIGKYNDAVDIEIFWSKGLRQKLQKIKPNQLITVKFDKKNCCHE